MGKVTILGQCPSKSNGYKIGMIAGHATLIKTKAVTDYEQQFYIQCPLRGANISTYFELKMDVYLRSLSSDLDGCFKVFLDCLQKCQVIKNDNRCVHIDARKFVDKNNPRIEFEIIPIEL